MRDYYHLTLQVLECNLGFAKVSRSVKKIKKGKEDE